MLEQAFEPFRQGPGGSEHPERGLGTGLTLVRLIAEAHEGSVGAHSDGLGRGSSFTLRLPLLDERERDAAGREPATTTATGPNGRVSARRILVVEDQADTAETMRLLLELEGHETRIASTGEEAVEAAHEFRPDVVLCDVGLSGMSGTDVARALRADPELPPARLIALTGYGQDADRKRAHEAGFDAFLVKPVRVRELRGLLEG